eukprot:TRINITY_DN316_c0_g1_i1.p1 TRINITY_DN316_c0_g1~~TRINITY_DN316_c0_g1_i1.p1  ORF type:complete len:200 (-),score=67.83 TRINITY_DN316_c0_g1_i1:92-610(-)
MLTKTFLTKAAKPGFKPTYTTQPIKFRSFSTEPKPFTVNLVTPQSTVLADKQPKLVTIPGIEGYSGILASHVPLISQLLPGLITIDYEKDPSDYFFVSGGFAIMTKDSVCNINVPEAVRVADLDAESIKSSLQQYNEQFARAQTDQEREAAKLFVDFHSEMLWAIEKAAGKQ